MTVSNRIVPVGLANTLADLADYSAEVAGQIKIELADIPDDAMLSSTEEKDVDSMKRLNILLKNIVLLTSELGGAAGAVRAAA